MAAKPKYIFSDEYGYMIRCIAGVPKGKTLPCPWVGRDSGCKADKDTKEPLCPWCGGGTQKIEEVSPIEGESTIIERRPLKGGS
jgi:hypothetical protein